MLPFPRPTRDSAQAAEELAIRASISKCSSFQSLNWGGWNLASQFFELIFRTCALSLLNSDKGTEATYTEAHWLWNKAETIASDKGLYQLRFAAGSRKDGTWDPTYFDLFRTQQQVHEKISRQTAPIDAWGGILVGVRKPLDPRRYFLPQVGVACPVTEHPREILIVLLARGNLHN